MSFRTKRVLISTPFYMVFEFFLLKYMFLLLGGCNDIYIMMMVLLIGLLRSVPMFFEAKKSTIPGRFLTAVDGVWMWASLMFLIDILIIYLIDMFIPLSFEIKIILLAVVPILGVYNYYKAHKLVVNEKTLKLDNLKHDINIVHLSDVHFGSVRHKKIIRQISDKLKELNMPIIFTPGNHDFYIDIEDVFEACKNAGIIILDNTSMEFGGLNIFGLRFSFEDRSVPEIEESLVKEGFVNIINYHVPYHWEEFSKIGFDIQLSGHTHGGQFYPAVNFAEILFKYNRGLFKNNLGRYLHVTTGVGSMDTPMRWGTDSELVILKLKRN